MSGVGIPGKWGALSFFVRAWHPIYDPVSEYWMLELETATFRPIFSVLGLLRLDNGLSRICAQLGIRLPGLSVWALARKR
jgi:hypothetical protein